MKSLDSVGIETSSSALSVLSAFSESGCKFWVLVEDIKLRQVQLEAGELERLI